jgi:hypothetical protein
MTLRRGRDPPRNHSRLTIQMGITPISSAARPELTLCSAHATLAFPPRSRKPPTTRAALQLSLVGASSPRRRATA